jgi:hypothetical protein
MQLADAALYEAKAAGRNCVRGAPGRGKIPGRSKYCGEGSDHSKPLAEKDPLRIPPDIKK